MTTADPAALARLQSAFLASVLPKVLSHGRVSFRHIKCRHQQEELLAEMTGLCWKWHLRLAARGKDATRFPTALATFAARAVRCGRKLAGMDRAKDVLSPSARRRHGVLVSALPAVSTLSDNPLAEALADNTKSPPDEQVCFRIDFPAWRLTRTERDRRVLDDLMVGERTLDVAGRHGLSPGRVSQLRREFLLDWRLFCDDQPQVV